MRLRLNPLIKALAYWFDVAKSTVGHIFSTWDWYTFEVSGQMADIGCDGTSKYAPRV